MKLHLFSVLMSCLLSLSTLAQKPAYKIYRPTGKSVEYQAMLDSLKNADVVFFGEFHNNPIGHWLEIEIAKDLTTIHDGKLTLGAEMFESDDQIVLNEYLQGLIKEKNFKDEAKLWPNYATDYAPLVEWAKEKQLNFIATNIPRRYAAMVAKSGFEALNNLPEQAKAWIAPLPVDYNPELECYKSMLSMGGMGGNGKPNENLPKAQAIKDATMAYFIYQNLGNGNKFLHFNGAYHSDMKQGIIWYLNKYWSQGPKFKKPALKIMVISMSEPENINNPDQESLKNGDFIINVPASMTKTY